MTSTTPIAVRQQGTTEFPGNSSRHERPTAEIYDLLIVGGGPAGVGTAYQLRDSGLSVAVLEAEEQLGGRTRSTPIPGGPANTGAQFVYLGTRTHRLVDELGLDSVPFEPRTYGISLEGVTSVGSTNAGVVSGLPLDDDEKAELLRFLDDAVAEYRAMTVGGVFTEQSEQLAVQSVAERLEPLTPRVRAIIEAAIRAGAVGDPARIIAQFALRYFASYVAHERENRRLLVGGMQSIVLAMSEVLPNESMMVSTTVTGVRRTESGVWNVTALSRGQEREYRARQVLFAVPSPLIGALCPDLPAWKRGALQKAPTPGNTTLVIAADVSGLPEERNWAMVTTVGSRFDCVLNATPGRSRSREEPDLVHFTCYANQVGYQPELVGDEAAEQEWIEDFLSVAPNLRGRIRGYHFQTWEHCFALLGLERAEALPEIRRPVDGLHFAGDWSSDTAGSHGAFAEADRVVRDILDFASLSRPHRA